MNDNALDIIAAHARDGARLRESFFLIRPSIYVTRRYNLRSAWPRAEKFCFVATVEARLTPNIWLRNL